MKLFARSRGEGFFPSFAGQRVRTIVRSGGEVDDVRASASIFFLAEVRGDVRLGRGVVDGPRRRLLGVGGIGLLRAERGVVEEHLGALEDIVVGEVRAEAALRLDGLTETRGFDLGVTRVVSLRTVGSLRILARARVARQRESRGARHRDDALICGGLPRAAGDVHACVRIARGGEVLHPSVTRRRILDALDRDVQHSCHRADGQERHRAEESDRGRVAIHQATVSDRLRRGLSATPARRRIFSPSSVAPRGGASLEAAIAPSRGTMGIPRSRRFLGCYFVRRGGCFPNSALTLGSGTPVFSVSAVDRRTRIFDRYLRRPSLVFDRSTEGIDRRRRRRRNIPQLEKFMN